MEQTIPICLIQRTQNLSLTQVPYSICIKLDGLFETSQYQIKQDMICLLLLHSQAI